MILLVCRIGEDGCHLSMLLFAHMPLHFARVLTVCIRMCMCVLTDTHYIQICVRLHTGMDARAHIHHACIYTYTHVHAHTNTHISTHTYTHAHMHVHTHAHTYTHTHMHTHTHTHTHTHIHTHTNTHTHTDDPDRINFKKIGTHLACGQHVPGLQSFFKKVDRS